MWKHIIKSAKFQSQYNWKCILKNIDFATFKYKYLDPYAGEATTVFCNNVDNCDTKCLFKNVKLLSTGLTACCPNYIDNKKIQLKQEDILMYSLNYIRIHKNICDLLQLEFCNTNLFDNYLWLIGHLKIGTGNRRNVYISYFQNLDSLNSQIDMILLKEDLPFILIIANKTMISNNTLCNIYNHNCICLYLNELINLQTNCTFVLKQDIAQIFKQISLNKTRANGISYITKENAKWQDVYFKALDNHTISVWIHGESVISYSYIEIGLANKKNGEPKLAFEFLILVLKCDNPIIELPSKTYNLKEHNKIKQYKKDLSSKLKQIFPKINSGEPFLYDTDLHAYVPQFNISR